MDRGGVRTHDEVAGNSDPAPGGSGTYLVGCDGDVYWTHLRVPEGDPTGPGDG